MKLYSITMLISYTFIFIMSYDYKEFKILFLTQKTYAVSTNT